MVERRPRRLALEDDLRLFVELGALRLVGDLLGVVDQLVELLVAPLRAVVAADGGAAEQGRGGDGTRDRPGRDEDEGTVG